MNRGRRKGGKHSRRKMATRGMGYITKAGPVTITHADGTVTVQEPYRASEFRSIVKERIPIAPKVKAAVRRRDRGTCRYCGSKGVPMEYDHVVPVALGGSNQTRNIVLACEDCNRRKGARVWTPRPLSA